MEIYAEKKEMVVVSRHHYPVIAWFIIDIRWKFCAGAFCVYNFLEV